jgi:hypothetical protein
MDRVSSNKFKITRRPVGESAPPVQPPTDAELELLDQLAASPTIAEQIGSMRSTSAIHDFDAGAPPQEPHRKNFGQDPDGAGDPYDPDLDILPPQPGPPFSRQAAPIGLSVQDRMFMTGYRPGFDGQPAPDLGRIPRADGRMYSNLNPGERVYENKSNAYGKEWLRRQVAYRTALSRDPMYHMAVQVAGRVGRRVLDLIEDPLEFAQPELVRQDPRLTVKDTFYPENPGAASTIPSAIGIPGFYSRHHVIEKSVPQQYRERYKKAIAEADAGRNPAENRSAALVQVIIGLRKKWNDFAFENKVPGVPDSRPGNDSAPLDRERYRQAMDRVRDRMTEEFRTRLSGLLAVPLVSMGDVQYMNIVELRQNIAELAIVKEQRWIEGAYEDLPGYEVLKKVFETGNLIQTRSAFDEWDRLFNNGMFGRQRMLAIMAESKKKEDADIKRDALLQILEGKPAVDPDRGNPGSAGKPAVNTRWMSLPENFGYIFFRETLQSAVDQSLADIAGFCKKGQVPLMYMVTNDRISSFFFDLIASNFRIFEIQSFRRNEEFRLLRAMQTRRLELLLKFTTLQYDPATDSLAFSDQPSVLFGGITTLRQAFQSSGARKKARWRPIPSGNVLEEQLPTHVIFDGQATAAYKSAGLRNGAEMEEFARSREFFANFS